MFGYEFYVDPSRCIGCQSCVKACAECDTHRGVSMIHFDFIDRARDDRDRAASSACTATIRPARRSARPTRSRRARTASCSRRSSRAASPARTACWPVRSAFRRCMPDYEQMMKCDMCYDRTSVGKRPMCATVCPSQALAYVPARGRSRASGARSRPTSSSSATRRVTTKVFMMVPRGARRRRRRRRRLHVGGAHEQPQACSAALARGVLDPHRRRALRRPPAVRQVPDADQPRHVRRQPLDPGPSRWLRATPALPAQLGRRGWARCPSAASSSSAIPAPNDPCILVRTGDGRVRRLQPEVHASLLRGLSTSPTENRLECPCHEGYFSVADGRVLQGPPPRPLPRIVLERRGDELLAVGVDLGGAASHERSAGIRPSRGLTAIDGALALIADPADRPDVAAHRHPGELPGRPPRRGRPGRGDLGRPLCGCLALYLFIAGADRASRRSP